MRRIALSLAVIAVVLGAGCLGGSATGESADLVVRWESDTATDIGGNHHVAAAGRVSGQGVVLAPISGTGNSTQCELAALAAANGTRLWNRSIPPTACTLHAVADATLADFDGDGTREALAATTERLVVAHHPLTGDREFRHPLAAYGYTPPVVADLTGDRTPELVVADAHGNLYVLRPDGTEVWTRSLEGYTWADPAVADLDADGAPELAVGLEGGRLVAFEGDGTRAWRRTDFGASVYWQTAGQLDADPAVEVVVATTAGEVAAVDGRDGSVEWRTTLDRYAAVRGLGDGDGDGDPEVYAGAGGVVYALAGGDGAIEWSTRIARGVTVTPPPVLGNLTGDGDPELFATADDGTVALLDPATGTVMDTYSRDVPLFAHAELADTDADGRREAYLVYGDGVVVAFSAVRTNATGG